MADLIEKLMQALDSERPARPGTHYDIGYSNGLTMAMTIARNIAKGINAPGKVADNWVPTASRLPQHGEVVLCYMKFKELRILQWDGRAVWWVGYVADFQKYDVTHWMPLPEPPKVDAPNITEETKSALNRMGAQAHGGEESE